MQIDVIVCGCDVPPPSAGVTFVRVDDEEAMQAVLRERDPDAVVVDRAHAAPDCADVIARRAPRAVRLVLGGDGAPPFEGGLKELTPVALGIAIGAARAHRALPALDDGTTVAGRLARALVHDVNNPLTVVLSSFEMLAERLTGNDDESRVLKELVVEGREGTARIQQLVHAHRTLARDLPEHPIELSVRAIVERALLLTAREFTDDVQIEATLDDTPLVRADETRFLRSLATLFFLVRQAASPGTVRVRTIAERDRAVIDVTYQGRALVPDEKRPIVAFVEKLGGAWSHGGHPAGRTILVVLPPAR